MKAMTHLALDQQTAASVLSGVHLTPTSALQSVGEHYSGKDIGRFVPDDEIDQIHSTKAYAARASVLAVPHQKSHQMGQEAIRAFGKPCSLLYDINGIFGKSASNMRL